MKKYTIFAGCNGTRKTTLYQTNPSFKEIPRINMDEIVREFGSWKNQMDSIKAGKIAVYKIKKYFSEGISFLQETTLCGNSILNNIKQAKIQGYSIIVYYVGVSSVEIAKERVKWRVDHGGHGIPESDIERRYIESFEKLKIILPLCDVLELYDNSEHFVRTARIENSVCVDKIIKCPLWVEELLYSANIIF